MATDRTSAVEAPAVTASPAVRRGLGLALLVIACAQLLISLDNTIVNIALPSMETGLDISRADLAWVVTAYALPFGGLLLVGGRAGDLFGRRRVFRIGLVVLTFGSLLGGLAPTSQLLITGRALQGIGSALIAPSALSLVATTFPPGPERHRAMGVYGAMGGLGATIGLFLGGLLTEHVSWRWVLFVNVPVAVAVLSGTAVLPGGDRERGRIDIPGALTVTASMVSLVYAITRASIHGWTAPVTLGFMGAAAVLLAVFIAIQTRSRIAMLPGHVVRSRTRAGANVAFLFVGAGMFGTYYFLTLYMQGVKHYSAMQTGLAYLPLAFGMAVSAAALGPKLLTRMSPRGVVALGLVVGTGGMVWFATLTPTSPYLTVLLPAMLVSGIGLGMAFVSIMMTGVSGVAPRHTGVASGLINTSQQIGGAIGLAVLATLAAGVTSGLLPDTDLATALTGGYTTAFRIGGGFYLAALVIVLLTAKIGTLRAADPAPVDH